MTAAHSFSDRQLADLTAFAGRLADAARAETLPRFRAGLVAENKADRGFDPVTEADRAAEAAIRTIIELEHPDHGIIGEEYGNTGADRDLRWVLDPVDGTRSFICGLPLWTTLIALECGGRPVIGVIDQPFTDERWLGAPGLAVYTRGTTRTPVRTDANARLATARLHTTDQRAGPHGYFTDGEAAAFTRTANAARLTRFGLDAYGYAQLAAGGLDAVIEAGVQRYDVAAPIALIRAAGGVITDWAGGDPLAGGRIRIAAAANEALHAELLEELNRGASSRAP